MAAVVATLRESMPLSRGIEYLYADRAMVAADNP